MTSRVRSLVPLFALAILVPAPRALALDHAGQASGTWYAADSPHVVTADTTVLMGDSLTIEPGCLVEFAANAGLVVSGALTAEGTEAQPIYLRAQGADAWPGDWDGLTLSGAGPHALGWIGIEDAATGLRVGGAAYVVLHDALVTQSAGDGIVFEPGARGEVRDSSVSWNGGAGVRITDASPTIASSDLFGNERAVSLLADAFPILFDLATGWSTTFDGVVVDTSVPVTGIGTWQDAGMPYVVLPDATLEVAEGGILILEAGAVVKLGNRARLLASGTLGLLGRAERPCALTALTDDTISGDTNRDAGATAPVKGEWSAVEVGGRGLLYMERTEVAWAEDGVRVFSGGGATVYEAEVHRCQQRGLAFAIDANATVRGSSFHDNDVGVSVIDPANIAMGLPLGPAEPGGGNTFSCNASLDVENLNPTALSALRNFWGATPPDVARIGGLVDVGTYLLDDPEAGARRRILSVARAGADLSFEWREATSCATTTLRHADRPDGPFAALVSGTLVETFVEAGGATDGVPVRYFEIITQ